MFLELILVFLIVVVGGFIQGASGFGFGLVAMGFLPIMLTLKESTLIVMALLLVASLNIIKKLYKYIELKGIFVILGSALVGRIVSFFVLHTYGEMEILNKLLGYFLIGMIIYLLFNSKNKTLQKKVNLITTISLGFLGGFIGGVFAVGGPFFVFYFLMLYQDKHKYNANLQLTVVVTSLFTLILHGVNGDFNSIFYLYLVVGTLGVYIGTQLGLKWFGILPNHTIKKLAMGIVLIAALNLVVFS